MAPEQAAGRTKEIGRATDIYALGAILYELLTGHPPFQAQSLMETLERVRTEVPRPPRSLRAEVPAELEAVCLACLAKGPRDRYPTAAALAEDLRRFLGDEAPRPPAGRSFSRRRRLWLAIAGGAVVLLAAGLAAWRSWPPAGHPPPGPQPDTPPPLHGSIDVLVYDQDDPQRQDVWLDTPGVMPLRIGDQFGITAELSRPAYVYVLWINPDGTVQPVHPWRPGRWEERPAEEEKAQRLRWPAAADRWYTIKPDRAGMITLVLLAREEVLPREVDLRAELGAVPAQTEQDLRATVWFENGMRVKSRRGRDGLFDETVRDDPVLAVQERLRERLLGKHFDYSLAVSFARRSE